MKRTKAFRTVLALAIATCAGPARAQVAGQFGGGVILGRPIGGAIKYWLGATRAFDAGIGATDGAVLYGDYLWQGWDILPQPKTGRLGAYLGLGPQLEISPENQFAIRTLGGVNYWLGGHPIEFFLEAGPVLRLTPGTALDADVGVGLHFYLGSPAPADNGKK